MAFFEIRTWWQSIGFWFWVLYFQTNTCFLIIHSSRGRTSRSNLCQSTVIWMRSRNLPQFLRITRWVTHYYSTPMYTPNLKTWRFLPEKGAELTHHACNHHAEHQGAMLWLKLLPKINDSRPHRVTALMSTWILRPFLMGKPPEMIGCVSSG